MTNGLGRLVVFVMTIFGISAYGSTKPERTKQPIQVAVTFDDMPEDIETIPALIKILHKHDVPQAFWLVNGEPLEKRPGLRKVLREWLAAGHRVGNHNYSHAKMKNIGVEAYIRNIDRTEQIMRDVIGSDRPESSWKFYRYPYLHQGYDQVSTQAVRKHLQSKGYRIVETTIDFGDWAWNKAYKRCMSKKDAKSIEALQKSYFTNAWAFLHWSVAAANQVFGRHIPHVLLLHAHAFNVQVLDKMLDLYKRQGVEFVKLDQVLSDPVYSSVKAPDQTFGDSLIDQAIITQQAKHPPWIQQPLQLLEVVCR